MFRFKFMVFNATFNYISAMSWRLVFLVSETGLPVENQRPVARHWQTLSHNVVSSTPRYERFEIQLPYDDDHDGPSKNTRLIWTFDLK